MENSPGPMVTGGADFKPGTAWRVGRKGKIYQVKKRRYGGRYKRGGYGRRGYGGRRSSYASRASNIIIGRGAYNWAGAWSKAKPVIGAAINGAARGIGTALGGAPGGTLGGYVGQGLNTILGLGAYGIAQNSVWASDESQVPAMHSMNETIRVTHREYIGDIYTGPTPGVFKVETYALNPGLSRSFPWLAPIANAFQEWQMLGFAAEFKSNSADALNSTNTALGSVVMCAQYNVLQPEFSSKGDMLNTMWAAEGKQSNNLLLPIECDPSQNPFSIHYVRSGELDNNTMNLQNYDMCNIAIATVGQQGSNVNIGELWFTYDIELRKPSIVAQAEGQTLPQSHFRFVGTAPGNAVPFRSLAAVEDDVGVTLGDTTITLDEGTEGYFMLHWLGAGAAGLRTPYAIALSNCTAVTDLIGGTSATTWFDTQNAGGPIFGCTSIFRVTDPEKPTVLTFTGGDMPAGAIQEDLFIIKYNPNT